MRQERPRPPPQPGRMGAWGEADGREAGWHEGSPGLVAAAGLGEQAEECSVTPPGPHSGPRFEDSLRHRMTSPFTGLMAALLQPLQPGSQGRPVPGFPCRVSGFPCRVSVQKFPGEEVGPEGALRFCVSF